ncbi:uncharacterized protein [Petaurus breviceps papuanus]|uniref:uncharacterized protein n=1 Tax=Petaurus breviceps papuanus TaxID=3040969 RepID=UPI0036DD203E
MDEIYKIASTERIQQLEKELEVQLTELKTEIQEHGALKRSPHWPYSSIRLPKDVSYFRKERELALRKSLQVAESKPLVVQADVLQRELESCLRKEYTVENLPLLLHQFYTERITQLIQSKYLHMLRWKRFCQHSSVMEQLYPLYQEQVGHIMQEYNDAVQRAERLAVARENLLTGKNNPGHLVTQEDLVIYTKWLVCHLHSLKDIHSYLRVLQYLPISDRLEGAVQEHPEVGQENGDMYTGHIDPESLSVDNQNSGYPASSITSTSGSIGKEATSVLPHHKTEMVELKPHLELLLSHFNICYNTEDLKNSADEMELFSLVLEKLCIHMQVFLKEKCGSKTGVQGRESAQRELPPTEGSKERAVSTVLVVQKFQIIFHEQQRLKIFPAYDVKVTKAENQDLLKPSMAFKKTANWIPFIKIKPKRDPWQQKLLIKLKERNRIDALMQLHTKFLKVSNPVRVMESLQTQASAALEPASALHSFVNTQGLDQCTYDRIWEEIYGNINLHQVLQLEVMGMSHRRLSQLPELLPAGEGHRAVPASQGIIVQGVGSVAKVRNFGRCQVQGVIGNDFGQRVHEGNLELSEAMPTPSTGSGKIYQVEKAEEEARYSYFGALQLLGFDEADETADKNPIMMRGAYLSFLYLRHLRIRELQRICLGILNYFRSVERTLTIHTSGLTSNAGNLVSSVEDACWVNTAGGGGSGAVQGLGSHHYVHYTPADYKVQSTQFMEFSEVENQDDFYTVADGYIHVQDQRGAYVMYDCALQDLEELESQLLLLVSHYIEREKSHKRGSESTCSSLPAWAHTSVDRFAILFDIWTWEATLLENKRQLLDSYFEAYQHVFDQEERIALAQVMTDIMHRRPRFDFSHPYFGKIYRDECICLRLHLQLVRDIFNRHIESQREYVQRIWRDDQKGSINEFGLPPNIICKHLISINNSCPVLKNIYLLEFHPSLGLASLIPTALQHLFQEFCHIYRPHTAHGITILEEHVLQLALDTWQSVRKPESLYSAQLQKDLFSDTVMEDPFLVVEIGMLVLESAAGEGKKQSQDSQAFLLETFSRLLELLTLRYRLIEISVESAHLAWLYKIFTQEMGFDEFHLYLRPIYFEFASHKEKADQPPPVFITALLEDNSRVDRYAPSTLQLAISEVDDNHIGKFSFHKKESIFQLLFHSGVENMQVVLACQTAQKNALMVTVQQAAFCHSPQPICPMDRQEGSSHLRGYDGADSTHGSASSGNDRESASLATVPKVSGSLIQPTKRVVSNLLFDCYPVTLYTELRGICSFDRTPEAFVSIQLEKLGLRDMMLNTFLQRKEIMGKQVKKSDEIGRVKREVIVEYCQKLNHRMSQYSLRGQIIAYCNSLRALLEDFPTIRNTFFMTGQPQERKREKGAKEGVQANPRNFQLRPRCLLSSDGRTFLNLWFIPHYLEVLIMFKTLPEKEAFRALKLTLRIIAPLHDIVAYLFSFAKLGSGKECFDFPLSPKPLKADWGGIEGIGAELRDVQRMIDSLQNPQDPNQVAQLLMIRREVMFLQFDAAVRHLIRGTFLLAGNISAYQTVTDSLFHGLQPMSNSLVKSVFASQLCLPQPLDPKSHQAFVLFPWRAFLADGGPFPVILSSPDPLEYNMQLCLCELNDQDRKVAHGELVSVQLLLEDVLLSSYDRMMEGGLYASPEKHKQSQVNKMAELNRSQSWGSPKTFRTLEKQRDPLTAYAFLRSFLIIWKQLEVLKEAWGRLKLRVADINTVALYQQFLDLYGANILYPTMKTIARQMGKEEEFEGLVINCRSILPPKGASEVEIKTRQLQKLLENFESHMIHEVLRKVNKEIALVMSEKAKEDCVLPTELWKHQVMKENVSIVRPQIVEIFMQRLMESYQDGELEITFKKDHLETCLLSLGCDVMAREHSNFKTYSMFYENLLQQANQMLYQKEQELNAVRTAQSSPEENIHQVAELVQDMILEITALRARLTDLEDESLILKEKIRKEVQEEYEALVRALFSTCLHIKEKLDEHQLKMNRKVCDLISEVRREGVDSMIDLKKKIGSSKVANGLKENLAKEQLQALQEENSRLEELVCKAKTICHWKLTVQQEQLQRQLRNAEKEATQSKKKYLRIKIMAEHKSILLQQQLLALRKALAKSQAENLKMEKQLDKQKQLLKEFEYKMTHETLNRQQLDIIKTSSMEKLLEDIEKKEQRLCLLTEEAERSSKMGQLQQKKIQKEIQQIRSQLAQERSLKLDAFQRVNELQSQLYDIESASIQINSLGGLTSWANYTRSSVSTPCRYSQQYLLKSDPKSSEIKRIQRPRTVPIKCRRGRESCLPNVTDNVRPATFRIPTAQQPTSLLRPTHW